MGCKWKTRIAFFRNLSHTIATRSSEKDANCPDTFAQSHRSLAVHSAGGIAANAEDLKRVKYADLLSFYIFVPVAINY